LWIILLTSALGDFGAERDGMSVVPSGCVLSQKVTERIAAIMGLKGEKTWDGCETRFCPGFDGRKYGLEQPFEAIAVRGLPPV